MFVWLVTQDVVFNGRYPAGNVLLSFSILMAGVSIRKILLVSKHMGLSAFSAMLSYCRLRAISPEVLRKIQSQHTLYTIGFFSVYVRISLEQQFYI